MALVVDSLSALGKAFAGADFAKVPHDVFGDSRNGRLEIGAETFCLEASVCGLLTADQVGPDVP
ncbi:hypothetical protein [Prosthecobacter sp.]|uniref:hypothetical protein n=1 Tax=Prosthecobacter sp. TaxID=1965333 RepID=UPI00378454B3